MFESWIIEKIGIKQSLHLVLHCIHWSAMLLSRTPGRARQARGVWDRFIPACAWDSFLLTSQWAATEPINWANYPLESIGIYVDKTTHSKESLNQRCRRSTNVQLWYFRTYLYGLTRIGWDALFCIANNCHDVTITTHAIKRHILIWIATVRQPTKHRCPCV